jgi:hypothetical protein
VKQRRLAIVPAFAVLVALAGLIFARQVTADDRGRSPCPQAVNAWALACGAAEGFSVEPVSCGLTLASFRVELEGFAYKIELTVDQAGFRHVGRFGVSPIGEYPDWEATPRPMHAALDKFVRCVDRGVDDALFATESPASPPPVSPSAPRPWPWRVAGAVAAGLVVACSELYRARLRGWVPTALGLLALGVATFALRRALFPAAFFHQNGHGALWIGCALDRPCHYGPGYRELFGYVAALDPSAAERPVIVASALLAATAPAAIWWIARGAGAPYVVAWALAIVAAIEPGLGRLAQSESYYGVTAWLLLLAAAAIASGARSGNVVSLPFAASTLGAGLLVSEAALVHPACWVPAAFVPIAAAVGPGSLVRRIKLGAAAAIGIGLVVAATAAGTMLRVYRAQSRWGAFFADTTLGGIGHVAAPVIVAATLMGATVALRSVDGFRRASRLAFRLELRLAAFGAVAVVAMVLDQVSYISPWLGRGYWALFLAPLCAAVASVLALTRGSPFFARVTAAAVLVAGLDFAARHRRALAALPTDALEAQWAASWRDELPRGASVAYLERAGDHVFTLPLYAHQPPKELRVFAFTTQEPEANHMFVYDRGGSEPAAFYYRASTCSTAEGQSFCQSLEQSLDLEPVRLVTLPALPSLPGLGYDAPNISVGLFRIRGVRR